MLFEGGVLLTHHFSKRRRDVYTASPHRPEEGGKAKMRLGSRRREKKRDEGKSTRVLYRRSKESPLMYSLLRIRRGSILNKEKRGGRRKVRGHFPPSFQREKSGGRFRLMLVKEKKEKGKEIGG